LQNEDIVKHGDNESGRNEAPKTSKFGKRTERKKDIVL